MVLDLDSSRICLFLTVSRPAYSNADIRSFSLGVLTRTLPSRTGPSKNSFTDLSLTKKKLVGFTDHTMLSLNGNNIQMLSCRQISFTRAVRARYTHWLQHDCVKRCTIQPTIRKVSPNRTVLVESSFLASSRPFGANYSDCAKCGSAILFQMQTFTIGVDIFQSIPWRRAVHILSSPHPRPLSLQTQ